MSFAYSKFIFSCILTSALFIATIYFAYKISLSPPVKEEYNTEDLENSLQDLAEDVTAWEIAYRHPLLVSPTEVAVKKDDKVMSYVLQE